jgi:hypothetical protein
MRFLSRLLSSKPVPENTASNTGLRVVAAIWLLACTTFLILTLAQPDLYEDKKTALARLVPVYFLSFPTGHLAVMAAMRIKLSLYLQFHADPDIFPESVFLWVAMTALGYVQWFLLLPWLSRKCWQLCVAITGRNHAAHDIKTQTDNLTHAVHEQQWK